MPRRIQGLEVCGVLLADRAEARDGRGHGYG
jgi:hypothetical protein